MCNTCGLGGRSIAARLTAIRGLYGGALTRELVAWNPARAVPNPRFRKPLLEVLCTHQLQGLLALPLREVTGSSNAPTTPVEVVRADRGPGVGDGPSRLGPRRPSGWPFPADGGGRQRPKRPGDPRHRTCASLTAYPYLRLPLETRRAMWGKSGRRMAVTTMRDSLRRYGNRIGVNLHSPGAGVAGPRWRRHAAAPTPQSQPTKPGVLWKGWVRARDWPCLDGKPQGPQLPGSYLHTHRGGHTMEQLTSSGGKWAGDVELFTRRGRRHRCRSLYLIWLKAGNRSAPGGSGGERYGGTSGQTPRVKSRDDASPQSN